MSRHALRPPMFRWTIKSPNRVGRFWYRESLEHYPRIVRVFRGEGELEWSYRYGRGVDDVGWVINCGPDVRWSDIPIPLPVDATR